MINNNSSSKRQDDKNIIIATITGDLTGNGTFDTIEITGVKPYEGSIKYYEQIKMKTNINGIITLINLPYDKGYNPGVSIIGFSGTITPNIVLSINTGGTLNEIIALVYIVENSVPILKFDSKVYSEVVNYNVIFVDNYKVIITNLVTNKKMILDISAKEKSYLESLYDSDGKIQISRAGYVGGVVGIGGASEGGLTGYLLQTTQPIYGLYSTDVLALLITQFVYENGRFIIYRQLAGTFAR